MYEIVRSYFPVYTTVHKQYFYQNFSCIPGIKSTRTICVLHDFLCINFT